jgi:hypothetical protein
MNQSKTTYVQTALLLGAMFAGAITTKMLPERHPLAGYVQHTELIPTSAVFKQAATRKHDASRDLTGIDVDVRRLAMLARVS